MRYFNMLILIFVVFFAFTARSQTPPVLTKVLEDVRKAYTKQERPMVIFDIDGAILDNRPRIMKIIEQYADEELQAVRPEDANKLKAITLPAVHYLIKDTLTHSGVTDPAIINNASLFWAQRFYSESYLEFDTPTAGAVDYIRTLYSNGARIVYLSGRDVPRQLLGTIKSLQRFGFPIGIQGTELILRPTMQTQAAVFKQNVTSYLRHYGTVIATFDNEPANINVYRRAFPTATVVLFEALHKPNPPPLLDNIVKIDRFR